MAGRFIKLYEQILNWEWFKKKNTLSLFIYLLLKANYCDTTFEGQIIHRGQIVTTLPKLACETGQTIKEVRDALSHLIWTGEVADKTTNKYRVITIVKYDEYQKDGRQMGSQRADKGQTEGRQTGSQRAACIEYIDNNIENIERVEDIERGVTAQRFTPPTRAEIEGFIRENGLEIDADRFLYYYQSNGWMVGRNPMRDWKAVIRSWAAKDRKEKAEPTKTVLAQQYGQRDYSGVPAEIMERQNRKMEEFLRQKREAEAKAKCAAG